MSPTIIFHIVDVFSALCGRIELIPFARPPDIQVKTTHNILFW